MSRTSVVSCLTRNAGMALCISWLLCIGQEVQEINESEHYDFDDEKIPAILRVLPPHELAELERLQIQVGQEAAYASSEAARTSAAVQSAADAIAQMAFEIKTEKETNVSDITQTEAGEATQAMMDAASAGVRAQERSVAASQVSAKILVLAFGEARAAEATKAAEVAAMQVNMFAMTGPRELAKALQEADGMDREMAVRHAENLMPVAENYKERAVAAAKSAAETALAASRTAAALRQKAALAHGNEIKRRLDQTKFTEALEILRSNDTKRRNVNLTQVFEEFLGSEIQPKTIVKALQNGSQLETRPKPFSGLKKGFLPTSQPKLNQTASKTTTRPDDDDDDDDDDDSSSSAGKQVPVTATRPLPPEVVAGEQIILQSSTAMSPRYPMYVSSAALIGFFAGSGVTSGILRVTWYKHRL